VPAIVVAASLGTAAYVRRDPRQFLEAALKLPVDERGQLVDELKATLRGGFVSEEVEQAWGERDRAALGRDRLGQRCSPGLGRSQDEILAELRGGT
jgi:hypothetical protein